MFFLLLRMGAIYFSLDLGGLIFTLVFYFFKFRWVVGVAQGSISIYATKVGNYSALLGECSYYINYAAFLPVLFTQRSKESISVSSSGIFELDEITLI